MKTTGMEFDAFSINVTFSEILFFSLFSRRKNTFLENAKMTKSTKRTKRNEMLLPFQTV